MDTLSSKAPRESVYRSGGTTMGRNTTWEPGHRDCVACLVSQTGRQDTGAAGAGKGWRRSKAVLHTGTRRPRFQSYLTP